MQIAIAVFTRDALNILAFEGLAVVAETFHQKVSSAALACGTGVPHVKS